MTVEHRSWRIDRDSPTSPGTYGVVQFEEGQPYEHVGGLVPDDRLQAITDAWDAYRKDGGSRYSEAMDNFVGVIMNIVEDNDE